MPDTHRPIDRLAALSPPPARERAELLSELHRLAVNLDVARSQALRCKRLAPDAETADDLEDMAHGLADETSNAAGLIARMRSS